MSGMQYHDKDILRRHHKMAFRGSVSTHTAAVHLYLVRLEDSGVPQRTHAQAVDIIQQPPRVWKLERVPEHVAHPRCWASSRRRASATARSAQTWSRGKSIEYSHHTVFVSYTLLPTFFYDMSATAGIHRCCIYFPALDCSSSSSSSSSSTARGRRGKYADLSGWGIERASRFHHSGEVARVDCTVEHTAAAHCRISKLLLLLLLLLLLRLLLCSVLLPLDLLKAVAAAAAAAGATVLLLSAFLGWRRRPCCLLCRCRRLFR